MNFQYQYFLYKKVIFGYQCNSLTALSQKMIGSANKEMRNLVNSGTLVKKDLQLCQAKNEMALKRKGESETEIAVLKKKLSKLSKD